MVAKRSTLVGGAVVLLVGASLAISAGPRERGRDRDERVAEMAKRISSNLAAATMFVTGDGRIEFWGVRRFEVDEEGNTRITIKTEGDITDAPTATVPVQFEFDDNGQISLKGVRSMSAVGSTLTLVLRPPVNVAQDIDDCEAHVPLPPAKPNAYCEATTCPTSRPLCGWVISGGSLVCDCMHDLQ